MIEREHEGLQRFLRHLPESDDLALIILKGHLLLEAEINDTLLVHLKDPDALKGARLSFSQRAAVLRAVEGPIGAAKLRENEIQKLNKIRNLLAHHLEPAGLEAEVSAFLEETDRLTSREDIKSLPVPERLKLALSRLCGELAGGRSAFKDLKISTIRSTPNKSLERSRDE
jgi:hypothetical protein